MIERLLELERSIDHGDSDTDRCTTHPKEKYVVVIAFQIAYLQQSMHGWC